MNFIGDEADLLARMMSVSAKRHEVIAGNIANLNTPNFRARELKFEDAFRTALDKGGADAALNVEPEVEESMSASVKADGNSVHLEREFSLMQKNQLLYNVYAQVLRTKLNHIRRALGSGG